MKCEICGKIFKSTPGSHLKKAHNINKKQYLEMFPNSDAIFSWNQGLTKETNEKLKNTSNKITNTLTRRYKNNEIVAWNKNTKNICKAWNKGLTKETNESVKINASHTQITMQEKYDSGELKPW